MRGRVSIALYILHFGQDGFRRYVHHVAFGNAAQMVVYPLLSDSVASELTGQMQLLDWSIGAGGIVA